MIQDQSYFIALAVYLGSALLALCCLFWWLRRSWQPVWLLRILFLRRQ